MKAINKNAKTTIPKRVKPPLISWGIFIVSFIFLTIVYGVIYFFSGAPLLILSTTLPWLKTFF